jgi:CelD/BcsL family acetyltransferase involved in cellulose biosynthesis
MGSGDIRERDAVPATPSPTLTGLASALRLRLLTQHERREAGRVWRALESRLGLPLGPASWAWTDSWLTHYGDVVGHRFAIAERGGEPRGIALLCTGSRRALRPRRLHLGTAGEPHGTGVFVEANRLVAVPEDRDAFAALLADAIDADRGWDRLCLDGVPPEDAEPLVARWPEARVQVEHCPVTDLTGGSDVLDALSSSRRRRLRATLRAFGPLELEWATDGDEAQALLNELIELHQRHWRARGERGAFSAPRFAAFHRDVVGRLVPSGGAAVVRVRRGSETVGCLYGLIAGTRLLFYQGGLRSYDDNRMRAGQASHLLFMRACRERGLTAYDFLAPATRYKLELATDTSPLVWAEIDRRRWRTGGSRVVRRLRRS